MPAHRDRRPGPAAPARVPEGLRRCLVFGLWPLVVVGTTLGFVAGFRSGWVELSLAAVPLLAMVVLFGCEFWLPERRGQGAWRDPQAWNDIGHGILGQGAGNALGQVTFVFAAALLAGEISERWGANLWPEHWPFWVQFPLALFLADGLDYARHRLEHRVSWLWPIHALHHDVDRMNVLKSSRGHGLDMLLRNLLVYAPLALVGVPREVMLGYAAAVTVFGPIAHSNISVALPASLHRLVLTPQVHRIHHARPVALSCSNYANVFPLWDILFGSFEEPDAARRFDYGIEEPDQPAGFTGQLWAPLRDWRRQRRRGPAVPGQGIGQRAIQSLAIDER